MQTNFETFRELFAAFGFDVQLYGLHDSDPKLRKKGAFKISEDEAALLNREGFGIFFTPNSFNGDRKKQNLAAIQAWFCECDNTPKARQLRRIDAAPVAPSLVVESKNGYHVYYFADDATWFNYEEIQQRLINYYQADPKAKDVARILRVPGFFHTKDPKKPFRVLVNRIAHIQYSEVDLALAFPLKTKFNWNKIKYQNHGDFVEPTQPNNVFESIFSINCVYALERLSGTPAVLGETYELVPQSNGNLNIWVNGKDSGCFIDQAGRIGSPSGGGPSIYNWLKWFGKKPKEILDICRQYFPEYLGMQHAKDLRRCRQRIRTR